MYTTRDDDPSGKLELNTFRSVFVVNARDDRGARALRLPIRFAGDPESPLPNHPVSRTTRAASKGKEGVKKDFRGQRTDYAPCEYERGTFRTTTLSTGTDLL